MWILLLVALGFVLIIFTSDISIFLSTFFAHPFRHLISVLGGVCAFLALSEKSNETRFERLFCFLSFYTFIFCSTGFLILFGVAYWLEKVSRNELWLFLIFSITGFFISILFDRFFTPVCEKIQKFFTQGAGTARDQKTDIRDIEKSFKQTKPYDPRKFFSPNKWFFGLDIKGKPIFFNEKNLPHTQITGTSGFGKSVLLGLLAFQAILRGESTFVNDPKHGGDRWLPLVCQLAALIAKVKTYFLDIRRNKAQLNIFQDATPEQIENLLITGFLLEDRGDAADYYRGKDRKMARFVAENYQPGMTANQISQEYDQYFRSKENEAESFANQLQEIGRVKAVNAVSGISLKQAMENGAVVYIAGDWEDPKYVKVQRMILARIIQIASERDNSLEEPKQVCVILDELSFQISKIFGDSLKVIRDKNLHFILAHQSINDLTNVPENMDANAFAGSVLANCPLKFTYRAADHETAQYFSDLSGRILADDESRSTERTLSLTDRVVGEKQVRQSERNLIDINMMLSLPPKTGVLFGNGIAKISTVYPIQVKKNTDSKKIISFDNPQISEKSDLDTPPIFSELE